MSRQCGPCTRTSQNKYFDCPPLMSDGRLFTDYRPRCTLSTQFQPDNQESGYLDSYKYRQYLISHADGLMRDLRTQAHDAAVCAPCIAPPDEPGTMLPHKQVTKCDGHGCRTRPADPNGLGTGRDYGGGADGAWSGNEREEFVAAKKAQDAHFASKANCCATAADDLSYYPMEPGVPYPGGPGRLAIPYGGFAFAGGDPTIRRMRGGSGCTYGRHQTPASGASPAPMQAPETVQ